MPHLLRSGLLALCLLLLAPDARAHFVWIQLRSGAPPTVEVVFSDGPHTDTAPSLARYLDGLEVRMSDGVQLALTSHPFGLTGAAPAATDLVWATHDMGLFQRPGSASAVKLDYDSKGAATLDAAGRVVGQTTEILLRADGHHLIARVLFRGAPCAEATLFAPRADGPGTVERTTDANGELRIALPADGPLALKARVVVDTPGEHDGEPYSAEHHYALLTVTSLPGVALPPDVELEAWQRLQAARRSRATLPRNVVGLAGVLAVQTSEHDALEPLRGEFERAPDGAVHCTVPGLDERATAEIARHVQELCEQVLHRDQPPPPAHLRLAPRDGHPAGREVRAGSDGAHRYRVTAERIKSEETVRGDLRTTVQRLAYDERDDATLLPAVSTRTVVRVSDGQLLSAETFRDTYTESARGPIPAARFLTVAGGAEDAGVRCIHIELRNLELLEAQ